MKKLCFKCEPFETEKIKECSNKNCGYKDDVDVEGCMSEYQHCCYYYYGECKNKSMNGWCFHHKNCQYKKNQKEIEELKYAVNMWKEQVEKRNKICDSWIKENEQLKQENEKLKSEIKNWNYFYKKDTTNE